MCGYGRFTGLEDHKKDDYTCNAGSSGNHSLTGAWLTVIQKQ